MSRVIKSFRTEDDKEYVLNPFSFISEKIKISADSFVLEEEEAQVSESRPHQRHLETQSIIEAAQAQAREIVDSAKKEAEQIVKSAREEAVKLQKSAEEKGRSQGYKDGQSSGLNEFKEKIQQAEAALIEVQNEVSRFYDEAEDAIFSMSLAMAEQVIGMKVERDDAVVVSIAKRLLEKARNGRRFTLKCNPLDLPLLTQSMDILSAANGGKPIELDDDRNITRGGCRLETDYGILDGTMDSQLEQLRRIAEDLSDET